MKNFEFKSQVATSIEQSKRLLELGLKKETADMMLYQDDENNPNHHVEYCVEYQDIISNKDKYLAFKYIEKRCVPAWSLHRLLFLYNQDYTIKELYNGEEVYDMLICAIQIAIEDGEFNEEYLKTDK